MMGKISFFLGLQISQSPRAIFINQSNYALESLKKYGKESNDPVDSPMVEKSKLDKDPQGKAVDPTHYRRMVGILMYLTASRPDLRFVVCMYARIIMSITKEQQQALDDALVPREQRLRIGNCNYRLSTTFKPKEPAFQVALDATVSFHKHCIKFKMNKKNYSFDLETFRDMLQICLNLPSLKFVDPPFEEEIIAFIRKLSGKVTRNDLLRLSRAQILWVKESNAYTTYYDLDNGKVIPKPKYVQRSTREKTGQAPKASRDENYHQKKQDRLSGLSRQRFSNDENDDEVSKNADNEDDDHDDDNPNTEDDNGQDDDNEQTESDNDGDDFVYPNLSTFDEEERHEEKLDEEEEGSDQRFHAPSHFESTDDEAYDEVTQEKTNEEEEVNKLYNDININLEGRDIKMTDALLANSSSVSSCFISKMLNPNPDIGIDSIVNLNTESTYLVDVPVTTNDEIHPSSITRLPLPPIHLIQLMQQTPVSTPTIAPNKEPFAGSNQGSNRRRSRKEPESTSAPKEMTSKLTGSSKEGSKSKTRSTNKSGQAEEEVHTVKDLEEPTHQELKTGFTKDHTVDEITQHPDWFQKPAKPPTPDRDWNKTLPAVHGPIQPWTLL
nr:retrovirus-related Pol polyprotein from transposon TNT 1-94 [Tanacetum cinerariifolium]